MAGAWAVAPLLLPLPHRQAQLRRAPRVLACLLGHRDLACLLGHRDLACLLGHRVLRCLARLHPLGLLPLLAPHAHRGLLVLLVLPALLDLLAVRAESMPCWGYAFCAGAVVGRLLRLSQHGIWGLPGFDQRCLCVVLVCAWRVWSFASLLTAVCCDTCSPTAPWQVGAQDEDPRTLLRTGQPCLCCCIMFPWCSLLSPKPPFVPAWVAWACVGLGCGRDAYP